MKKIVLKFDTQTGEVKIETYGFQGPSCQDALKFLESSLGSCTDFQKKAEWYEKIIPFNLNTNLCA